MENFPLNPGSSWTYQDLEGNLDTMVIKSVLNSKGIPLIETTYGDQKPFYYIISNEGLFRLQPSISGKTDTPRGKLTLLAKWPLKPGLTWQSPWSDPPLSFKVLSHGPVTLAAGTFEESIKIGYRPLTSPIFTGFIWLEPGVGILAQEESGYRSELVSYTLSDLLPPAATNIKTSDLAKMFQVGSGSGVVRRVTGTPVVKRAYVWVKESGVPFAFFILILTLFFSVIILIMRSGRIEINLADDREVLEGEATLASAMVREGLYDEAVRILQRLTTRHPQWPDVAALLGKAYRNIGRLEEACLELKRALTLNPDMPSARLELVRTYLDLYDPARALTEVDTVLTEHERFADALYLRGEALKAMGKYELALEAYREALTINPAFQAAQEALERVLTEPAS
jgi:tetratricopeptide (TPR) repeat protein